MKKILSLFLILLLSFSLVACTDIDLGLGDENESNNEEEQLTEGASNEIEEDGHYTSKQDVALYLYTYNKLPNNYITKKEASNLGWKAKEGNLWDVTDKMSIGGDRFGNREKKLPTKSGRSYFECDINYEGGYRGPERIVYSDDGLIYYTGNHYESFTLLYGDE